MAKQNNNLREKVDELDKMINFLATTLDKSPKKGILDHLSSISTLISGVLIAAVGTVATITYNERQTKLAELQALDKYRAYLTSQDPQERVFGYEAFVALGQEEFVARWNVSRKRTRV